MSDVIDRRRRKVVAKTTLLYGSRNSMNTRQSRTSATWRIVLATAIHERCSASGEQLRKYDRGLRQLRHAELHWLDVADRVTFKLCMTDSA